MMVPQIVGDVHGYRFRRELRRAALFDAALLSAAGLWAIVDHYYYRWKDRA